ncbi:MAG TPA: DUF4157 domain-containing protein [Longimicrobiaceae bacterium]
MIATPFHRGASSRSYSPASATPKTKVTAPLQPGLRSALEHLSGFDLRHVRVHADSPLPALVGARAFAYGSDIHLAAGAGDALAHEAWHVVQQMQGRVRATARVNGLPLNDDAALEQEAEEMAARALALAAHGVRVAERLRRARVTVPVVQRFVEVEGESWDLNTLDQLREQIDNRFHLTDFNVDRFVDIVTDLVNEGSWFARWQDLEKEIRIREVGYAVVAALEGLLVKYRPLYARAMQELAKWDEEQRPLFEADQKKQPSARTHYANDDAFRDARQAEEERLTRNILTWGHPSYTGAALLNMAVLDRPMFKWLTGARDEDPLVMNCWELVAYGLVLTGLADKSYITWCNLGYPRKHPDFQNKKGFVNLAGEVTPIMDFYCVAQDEVERESAASPTFVSNTTRRMTNPKDFADTKVFCASPKMTIPRGRILMFNAGAHFAISTGKRTFIRNPDAIKRFKTKVGHGIIQLDDGTIEESTVEDLPERYLQTMVVAPFPGCPAQTVPLNKTFPRTAEEREELKSQFSDEVESDKQEELSYANAELNKKLQDIDASADEGRILARNAEQQKKLARTKSQKQLQSIEKNASSRLKEMVIDYDAENPRTVSYQLVISACDPYRGTIQL